MLRGERLVKGITALILSVAVVILLASYFSGAIGGVVTKSVTLPNVGSVTGVGVGVYWDSGCSKVVSSIDWGVIQPGSTKDVVVYVRNEGNVAVTLAVQTKNWNPSTAPTYITFSWNYGGQSISPNGVIPVTLRLTVSSSIQGITSFSFDIVITASG